MRIKAVFLIFLLASFSSSALAKATAWEFAFTSESPKELIAGHGASLFEIDGNSFSGPIRTQEHLTIRLHFTIEGTKVTGTFTPEEYEGKPIELIGELKNVTVSGDYPCRQIIQMSNGIHTVILKRLVTSCSS